MNGHKIARAMTGEVEWFPRAAFWGQISGTSGGLLTSVSRAGVRSPIIMATCNRVSSGSATREGTNAGREGSSLVIPGDHRDNERAKSAPDCDAAKPSSPERCTVLLGSAAMSPEPWLSSTEGWLDELASGLRASDVVGVEGSSLLAMTWRADDVVPCRGVL